MKKYKINPQVLIKWYFQFFQLSNFNLCFRRIFFPSRTFFNKFLKQVTPELFISDFVPRVVPHKGIFGPARKCRNFRYNNYLPYSICICIWGICLQIKRENVTEYTIRCHGGETRIRHMHVRFGNCAKTNTLVWNVERKMADKAREISCSGKT